MRRQWGAAGAAVMLVLGLAASGCGDDDTGGASPTVTLAAADLQGRMLRVADVGAGWKLGSPLNEADYADAGNPPCEDMALNPTILARLVPIAGAQFEPVDGSSRHLIEFGLTGDPDRLAADLAIVDEGYGECATAGSDVEVRELRLPAVGDQRFGYVMTASQPVDGGTATWYVRMGTVRRGSVAVQVALTEILASKDAKPALTDDAFFSLVRAAATRLTG
jgi:hypothetical protein